MSEEEGRGVDEVDDGDDGGEGTGGRTFLRVVVKGGYASKVEGF